uniref:Putative salivary protein mys n=1 Tax=Rhodnius prolixus TaxID=13249 RepID=R4G525_RHOPR
MLVLKLILLIPVLIVALDEDEIDDCKDGEGYRTCTPSFPVHPNKKVTVTVRYNPTLNKLQKIEVAEGGTTIITESLLDSGYPQLQVCKRPSGNHICLRYNRVNGRKGTDICYIISTSGNTKFSSARCDRMTSSGLIYIPAGSNLPK